MNVSFNEEWAYWEPIPFDPKIDYYLESICDDPYMLTLILKSVGDAPSTVELVFKGRMYTYRKTDECFSIQLFSDLSEKYGGDFYGPRQFFIVKNSDYLAWLLQRSSELSELYDLVHYCFMDDDYVVDIVTDREPMVVRK